MTNLHTYQSRWAALREDRQARRARRDARADLAQQLAAFTSPGDLLDLSATLARYDDAETESIRNIVDWTVAA